VKHGGSERAYQMKTAATSRNLECWNGTTYGYETCPTVPRRKSYRAFGKEPFEQAAARSQEYLLSLHNPATGHWVGEVESNSTLTSEYVFFMHFMDTVDELR